MTMSTNLLYEYARHEENYAMEGMLAEVRTEEQAAARAATTGPR